MTSNLINVKFSKSISGWEQDRFRIMLDYIEELKFYLIDPNRTGRCVETDIIGIIGEKSAVSEILNGKRSLNLKHIKKLAEKFHVKPATFV
jgi:antitoxin component HigA of HigAB toxin-antitoxin module